MVAAVLVFNIFSISIISTSDDKEFEAHGISVLVDDMSLGFLEGAQLDYVEELLGSYFKVENPNATASCGCGTSFCHLTHQPQESWDDMRIASWNVNSMKARLSHVLDYCKAGHTDVILAQELKLTDDNFPIDAFKEIGWNVATHGQKTYNGVAILSKITISKILILVSAVMMRMSKRVLLRQQYLGCIWHRYICQMVILALDQNLTINFRGWIGLKRLQITYQIRKACSFRR